MNRRSLLLASLGLVALGAPSFAAQKIYRVNGRVSPNNVRGLQVFLLNSVDAIVGLKLHFSSEKRHGPGIVTADADDGSFSSYMAGEGAEIEIFAEDGYEYRSGDFVFDSFYLVKYGGMHQGIHSVSLNKVTESSVLLSGLKVTDIEIDRLNPKIRS
jgi:hypothetical protein